MVLALIRLSIANVLAWFDLEGVQRQDGLPFNQDFKFLKSCERSPFLAGFKAC
ncbi:hypothetical protein F4823DRAFT_610714 [Ustulina deusta]|nr:hypothetical protein F4823DRAFT_610714 [Ustulina deusta]